MKILYRQSLTSDDPGSAFLMSLGIKHCFLKLLLAYKDTSHITLKQHHHTHYEIHIVNEGAASYEIGGKEYALGCGNFLLIPPRTPHRVLHRDPDTVTVSITFHIDKSAQILADISECVFGVISPQIRESIERATFEHEKGQSASSQMIAAALSQILLSLWRDCGIEISSVENQVSEDNPRLALALQYIHDNIEFAPTVFEVSEYCHLSTKHLTRLFMEEKGEPPAEYIRKYRVQQLELMLMDTTLSLQDISERMHFSSEYYFHTFFKKNSGMTPREFRLMHSTKNP